MIQGKIIRVAGPVVDVQFTAGRLPALQEALTVTAEGTERTMEVAQHVNESTVRCIMLSASEGLGKGMVVTATGHGLTAPVGEATLGRMFDPLGRPIDGKGSVDEVPHWPIHRKAPSFAEQKPATEILETGIKVIDLLENGETDPEVVQETLDEAVCGINDLQEEFDENDSEIETVARECIAATVAYILEWFNIPIDTEEAIRERDW